MNRPRVRIVILLALISLVAGTVIYVVYVYASTAAAYTPPPVPVDLDASSFSNRFARRLLEKLGYPVRVFGVRYERDQYSTVIRRYARDDDWAAWKTWLEPGRTLILLVRRRHGDRTAVPRSGRHPLLAGVDALWLNAALTLEEWENPFAGAATETVLARRGRALIARIRVGRGEAIVAADAAVFSDESLLRGDNAVFLNNCLASRFPAPVVFDETPSGSGGPGPDAEDPDAGADEPPFLLFREPFLPVFLQSLALGLVFCLAFWKRFGPPLDPGKFARRSILRHLEAVGNFFEKTRNPLVFADILDRHFFARVRALLRFKGGSRQDLLAEVKRRLPLTKEEEDAFSVTLVKHLVARDDRREQIISRLKGENRTHGKNKIAG